MSGVVEDKDRFREALRDIRDKETTNEDRKEREAYVMEQIQQHGELVIFGDQLTINMIQTAIDAQKGSVTILERLNIISVTSTGLFHLDMNITIHSYLNCMPLDRTLDDPLSMAWFKLKLNKTYISNMPNVIKTSGKYEDHRRFFEGIGREFLLEALQSTMTSIEDNGEYVRRSRGDWTQFFDRVLEENDIKTYYEPNEEELEEPEDQDDMRQNASNLASRFLLSDIHRQAEREGDNDALTAVRINAIAFFYNVSGNKSKYAPTLMFNLVDYLGASSTTRKRMDIMVCANLSGKAGSNAHQDKVNEWFVREVKEVSSTLILSVTFLC